MATVIPQDARLLNRIEVFDFIRTARSATRLEIAKAIRLSTVTVGRIADELLEEGLLEEINPVLLPLSPDRMGRPTRTLVLNQSTPLILAIQIGVRNTRLCFLPLAGPLNDPATDEGSWPVTFKTPASREAFIRELTPAIKKILNSQKPRAVSVSVPGALDEASGITLLSPNLSWLHNQNLGEIIRAALAPTPAAGPTPICFVQEIRALALGHLWSSENTPSRGTRSDFLLVDLGLGVGGALAANSRLYDSPLPLSGEIGHSRILGNKRPCGCGNTGCLETLLSRRGLLATFAKQPRAKKDRNWKALVRHLEEQSTPTEPPPWVHPTLEAAGAAIASAINLVGVREIVLTGFLTELPPSVPAFIAAAIRRSSMWAKFGEIRICTAPRRRALGLAAAAIDRVLLPALVSPDAPKPPELATTSIQEL